MTIQAGTVIENPVIGDRIVLLDTSAETGGELLRFDLFARPGAPGPPEHVHPKQEERFAVISGTLRGRIDGEEREFSAGDKFVNFDVNHVAHPPLAVQKLVFSILAPLGRLMGYRADYPYPYDRNRWRRWNQERRRGSGS